MTTPPLQPPNVQVYAPVPSQSPDRTGLLITAGIFELLMALGLLGMVGIVLLGALLSSTTQSGTYTPGVLIKVVALYGGLAVFLIVMAVGTMQAKRWARALMNAVCWLWLVFGIVASLVCAAVFPRAFARVGHMSQSAILALTIVMCCFVAFFLIVVPGLLLLIYRSESVKTTCERKNPTRSWTDRFATGPLILLMFMLFTTAADLWMAFSRPMFPLFGKYLTHWPGAIAFAILGIWWAYLTWNGFFLRYRAWLLTLVTYSVMTLSSAITLWRADLGAAYKKAGFSAAESASASSLMKNPAYMAVLLGVMLATPIFVATLRKYYSVHTEDVSN